jgi:putative PIN family toxin of toxin-antitoxin system
MGAPAQLLQAWIDGAFEMLVSPLLLAELERALAYPKLRERIPPEHAARMVDWLRRSATVTGDPDGPPPLTSRDPGDDYLLGLAVSQRAALVSGDRDLLSLGGDLPIYPPADFLRAIAPTR